MMFQSIFFFFILNKVKPCFFLLYLAYNFENIYFFICNASYLYLLLVGSFHTFR